jgi:hypothetical protein
MTAALAAVVSLFVISAVAFIWARLLDAAGEAEWAAIDAHWRDDGPATDVITALRIDLYRRSDRLAATGRGKS